MSILRPLQTFFTDKQKNRWLDGGADTVSWYLFCFLFCNLLYHLMYQGPPFLTVSTNVLITFFLTAVQFIKPGYSIILEIVTLIERQHLVFCYLIPFRSLVFF